MSIHKVMQVQTSEDEKVTCRHTGHIQESLMTKETGQYTENIRSVLNNYAKTKKYDSEFLRQLQQTCAISVTAMVIDRYDNPLSELINIRFDSQVREPLRDVFNLYCEGMQCFIQYTLNEIRDEESSTGDENLLSKYLGI